MINFFQKYKKTTNVIYAVVVFTFVGAGFLGWGSYNPATNSQVVQEVKGETITHYELNTAIGSLAENKFKLIKAQQPDLTVNSYFEQNKDVLREEALKQLINKKTILAYAKNDLMLTASNDDIVKYLVNINVFHKNGKFDKDTYIKTLKYQRVTPSEFETLVKDDLIYEKFMNIIQKVVKSDDMDASFSKFLIGTERELSLKILDLPSNSNFTVLEEDVKSYWEANKELYKTKPSYNISVSKKNLIDDFKAERKAFLKEYISLKNNKSKFDDTYDVTDTDVLFKELDSPIVGKVYKPIRIKNSLYIVKINSINKSKNKSFDFAYDDAKQDFIKDKAFKNMINTATKYDFNKNDNIGYISRINDKSNLKLYIPSQEDYLNLIKHIMNSKTLNNYIVFDNMVVYYRIENQRINKIDDILNMYSMFNSNLSTIKMSAYINDLILEK